MSYPAVEHLIGYGSYEQRTSFVQDLQRDKGKDFPLYIARLILYFGNDHTNVRRLFYAVSLPKESIYASLFSLTSDIYSIVSIAAENCFEGRKYYSILAVTRPELIVPVANLLAKSKDYFGLCIDSTEYFFPLIDRFYQLEQNTRIQLLKHINWLFINNSILANKLSSLLLKLEKSDLLVIIKDISSESFKEILILFIEKGSPSLLVFLEHGSDKQLNCIHHLPLPTSRLFLSPMPNKEMFNFILSLKKERREYLFEAPILERGLSVKGIIKDLDTKRVLHQFDIQKLAYIPPPLLVACFIRFETILKLSPYLTDEQLKFTSYYGRRTNVIKMYNHLKTLKHSDKAESLKAGLPLKPELHDRQLTFNELV